MDALTKYPSYVSPSRIRTLIVPIGKWKRQAFVRAVDMIKNYSEIRLLDITPIDSPLFTPQAFPSGRLLFDFDILAHNDSLELFLYDFQPFRKTFVIIGLVNDDSPIESNLQVLKEKYPTAISVNLIYSKMEQERKDAQLPNVFLSDMNNPKNLEMVLCDIGRNFLEALSHYYSSYKHVTLRSPGAIGGNSITKTVINRRGPNTLTNPTDTPKPNSTSAKRLSSFELTTNSIKRSASLKLASTLSTTEGRTQQKSRGRQLKILGNFQLLAGRYADALTSFTESVTLLYKLRDFLWLASAIDGIAICFISLSYLDIPFQIPEIIDLLCPVQKVDDTLENTESATSTASKPVSRTSISTLPSQLQSPRASMNITATFLDLDVKTINLPALILRMSEKIMYYYELTLTSNSEYVPSIVYCNFLLKTLTFMVACHNSSVFTPEILDSLIDNKPNTKVLSFNVNEIDPAANELSREEIYIFADRLFQLQLNQMSLESQVNIYITLSHVFDALNFQRKKALILKMLLNTIQSSAEHIMWSKNHRAIIEFLLDTYGISDRNSETSVRDASEMSWFMLQKNALSLCLSIVKKFNDTEFTSILALKLLTNFTHMLTASEQQQLLVDYIQPCISRGTVKSYWDPFIIRGCSFQRLEFDEPGTQSSKLPVEMEIGSMNSLSLTDIPKETKTDEVFNPFKHTDNNINTKVHNKEGDSEFLVGDMAEFTCTLQNPFKFEIAITDIQFSKEVFDVCELRDTYLSEENPYIISANSIKQITLPVIMKKPTGTSNIYIDRLQLSVFGLDLEEFKIVNSERVSIPTSFQEKSNRESVHENTAGFAGDNERCTYDSLNIKILPEQPQLQIMNKSDLSQNSLMILDGTKTKTILCIRNKSLTCPIDYIQFHTVTNIERELKNDYWKRNTPDALYELENRLNTLQKSTIRIENNPKSLKPGEDVQIDVTIDVTEAPFEFTDFSLLIKYGMYSTDKNHAYAKELEIPYEVTIRKTVEVASLDVIPLNEAISEDVTDVDWICYLQKKLKEHPTLTVHDYVLVLLDFRNSWLDGLYINVDFDDFNSKGYLIEANHTLRMIIPVKKIDFQKKGFANKAIPQIVEGRQFIQSGLNKKEEGEMREAFWCREYLLSGLQCNWKFFHDSNLSGAVDFRKFLEKFDSKIVSTIYKGKSLFSVKLSLESTEVTSGDMVRLTVELSNTRSHVDDSVPAQRKLNLWILDHSTSKILPRSNRRVLYNGTLVRTIETTKPCSVNFDLLPIESGKYELCAAVARPDSVDPLLHFDSESVVITVK
ncbi:Trs120 protein [Maudiozyma humilis]|uniref:Trs120 protein n=1 Tax=Maudiozyma humilis TaxID=51915 RepID=A0AAV5S7E4_MAUHU|nr:Trs120 protein [Kazachstania humilis]